MASEVGRELIARVRAAPDDWDSWRVYADWLTEEGDARGELIALEHRLLVAALSADERSALQVRAGALLGEHREAWMLGWVPPDVVRLDLRGGFLVGVWLSWGPDTLAILADLVAHPVARVLSALDLSHNRLGKDGARALAASKSLAGLARLDLTGNGIGTVGVRALVSSEAFASLSVLCLGGNSIDDKGVRALAASAAVRSLTELDLGGNRIGPEGARELAGSAPLSGLTALDLSYNRLGDEGARALAASTSLGSLVELDLSENGVGADGRAALAASASLRGCQVSA
jgi:uncharacterized protein (TIGR02996 family)